MPTYDYRCTNGHTFEVFHSIKDDSPRNCPECDAPAKRVPSGGAGLLFKGSGFYITDYRSDSYKKGAKSDTSGSGGAAPAKGGDSGGGTAKGGDSKSSGSGSGGGA